MSTVWSGPIQPGAARFWCSACGHRVQTARIYKACPACGAGGFSLNHMSAMIEGPSLPVPETIALPPVLHGDSLSMTYSMPAKMAADLDVAAAARRIIADPLGPITGHIFELADAICERTGRHGITRISLTPEVGLAFGIAPGTSLDLHTPSGRVEVYAERGPRFAGTFTIPRDSDDEDRNER
jgi:hypothetical protein